jgi:hypothetical protein
MRTLKPKGLKGSNGGESGTSRSAQLKSFWARAKETPLRGSEWGQKMTTTKLPHLEFNLEKLDHVMFLSGQAGYTPRVAPYELWRHSCLIAIWHPDKRQGYLISHLELGLIVHYGIETYLNPHNFSVPIYKDELHPNRLRAFAESAIARAIVDVETAAPGTSNAALNRAAFVLGRFALGWHIDPDSIQGQLLEAAMQRGTNKGEARAVIASGYKTGQRTPKEPSDLLGKKSEHGSSPWAKSSPWGR